MPVLDVTRSGLGRLLRRNMLQIVTERRNGLRSLNFLCALLVREHLLADAAGPVSLRAVLRAGRLNRFGLGQLMTGSRDFFVSKRRLAICIGKFRSASCTLIMVLDTLVSAGCRVAAGRHDLVTQLGICNSQKVRFLSFCVNDLAANRALGVCGIAVFCAGFFLFSNRNIFMLACINGCIDNSDLILQRHISPHVAADIANDIGYVALLLAGSILSLNLSELMLGGIRLTSRSGRSWAGCALAIAIKPEIFAAFQAFPILGSCAFLTGSVPFGIFFSGTSFYIRLAMQTITRRGSCGSHDGEHAQQHGQHQKDAE